MAISFVGSATGTNTATMPSHQAGDYIVVYAFRTGSATAPTQPGGYTELLRTGSATAPAISVGVFGKIAASGSETVGTFTNAQALCVQVYRGVHQTTPAGTPLATNGNALDVTYRGLTLDNASGSSWVVAGAIAGSANVSITPSGMVNRADAKPSTGYDAAVHDTNGGVTSWSQVSTTNGTGANQRFISATFELKAAPLALAADSGSFTLTGSAAALNVGRRLAADGGSFALAGADAALRAGRVLPASAGGYTLSGQASGLLYGRILGAGAGSFSLSGSSVSFLTGVGMPADSGTFTLAGGDVTFLRGLRLDAQSASFGLSSIGAGLLKGHRMDAAGGSFALSGAAASFLKGYRVAAQAGSFTLSGSPVWFAADLDGYPVNVLVSGEWKTGRLRIYRSGSWVEPVVKRWDGASWV